MVSIDTVKFVLFKKFCQNIKTMLVHIFNGIHISVFPQFISISKLNISKIPMEIIIQSCNINKFIFCKIVVCLSDSSVAVAENNIPALHV
jgi:hypothetical protein